MDKADDVIAFMRDPKSHPAFDFPKKPTKKTWMERKAKLCTLLMVDYFTTNRVAGTLTASHCSRSRDNEAYKYNYIIIGNNIKTTFYHRDAYEDFL